MLKWVGGKRQLLPDIVPMINKKAPLYVEPFIGGGAVLFNMQPKKAIINDYNQELINVYITVRDNLEELLDELRIHEENNSSDYYYEIRALDRAEEFAQMSNVEKAARIIYLNKTCYNGLYRVNMAGQLPDITQFIDCLHSLFTNIDLTTSCRKLVSSHLGTSSPEVHTLNFTDIMSLSFTSRHHVDKLQTYTSKGS